MKQTLDKYILQILSMIDKIERYTSNIKNYEEFLGNEEKIDACITPFIQIWEIAWQMSRFYPFVQDIPYKDIVGFRNILVHTYHKIDTKAIWSIIQNNLPRLKKLLLEYKP